VCKAKSAFESFSSMSAAVCKAINSSAGTPALKE
jgi:hypothetical protein